MVNTRASAGPAGPSPAGPGPGTSTVPDSSISATVSATVFTTVFPTTYKSRKTNWDNIDKLQGLHDYDDWSHQVSLLLAALHLDKVVIDGVKPSTEEDTPIYQNMVCDALYMIFGSIFEQVTIAIVDLILCGSSAVCL